MARYNNVIVDIPSEATVVSGRVYIVTKTQYLKDRQYNNDSRLTIGWVNDTTLKTMNPNTNYVARYPREFALACKGKLVPVTRRVGMYMLSLALSQNNGMYPMLVKTCGPENANAIMDFANYSILFKSNVAKDFAHQMADQVLYSERLYSDSWFSDLFEKKITKSQQEDFKDKWVKACKERGIDKVWLCIDGSNNDCTSEEVELSERGKAKSHKNIDIVSYMMAVDAGSGLPITERIYRGCQVDSKAFMEIMAFLKCYSIGVEGVIVDRGFCDIRCLETILDMKLHYIIMMKENTSGFNTMYKKHADEIRMKCTNGMGGGIYAVSDECRIFGKYDQTSCITLIYDSINGQQRANYLFDKVKGFVDSANEQLEKGEETTIKKELKPYIITVKESKKVTRYEINHEKLQEAMDKKGFSAIAADLNYGPEVVLAKYDLRDKSEKAYMVIKTQLGSRVFRTHYTQGVEAKGFVAFIASIVRQEFARICKKTGLELTTAIREANFLCVQRTPDNNYMGVHNAIGRQLDLLAAANLEEDDIDYFALEESHKANGEVHDQIHKAPVHPSEDAKTQDGSEKRGPGRPKGSSNTNKEEPKPEEPKRGRGRPKGSKNKPKTTTESAATASEATEPTPKRGPGRPKGSKNKKPAVNAKEKRQAAKADATAQPVF